MLALAHLQLYIHTHRAVDGDLGPVSDKALEAGLFDGDSVDTGFHAVHGVVAGVIGNCFAAGTAVDLCGDHFHAGDSGVTGIGTVAYQ